jgi:hypothetical protein
MMNFNKKSDIFQLLVVNNYFLEIIYDYFNSEITLNTIIMLFSIYFLSCINFFFFFFNAIVLTSVGNEEYDKL